MEFHLHAQTSDKALEWLWITTQIRYLKYLSLVNWNNLCSSTVHRLEGVMNSSVHTFLIMDLLCESCLDSGSTLFLSKAK